MASPIPSQSYPRQEIKVLLLENIHASAHQLFVGEGYHIETIPRALKEEELVERLADGVHLLGIRSKTRVTARALEAGKSLLAVGAFCIGTNQIDLAAAKRCGVPVYNSPFSNTRSVAELVICEVIMLSRQLGDRSREVHEGRAVVSLSYEAYQGMAEREMARIASEARARFPGVVHVCLVHRLGEVPLAEASVVVAVSSPHRAEAFDACRFAIDALKASVPIWKKESYRDGGDPRWIANREAGGAEVTR